MNILKEGFDFLILMGLSLYHGKPRQPDGICPFLKRIILLAY
jgi:hypothetical protein